MRKMPVILFGFLIVALISMSTISLVQADIETPWWVDPEFRGYDSLLFHDYIVAYRTGGTAQLCVPFSNNYGMDINVTSVRVWFDWGETYNSTECNATNPFEIKEDGAHTFTITFTVPSTTIASNMVLHRYRITVEFDGGSDWWNGDDFAVFSTDQADAFQLYNELDAIFDYSPYLDTAKAKVLWSNAIAENSLGVRYYQTGNFNDANATFHTARDLVDQAFEAEDERGSKLEDAMMNYYNAAMIQAYAWLLFGLGMVLIGIGAIVYAARKPKVA